MLDTHILIYLMKNKPPGVAERANALGSAAELCMSFFTFAELLMGAESSTRKPNVLRRLDALTRVVPLRYSVNRAICEHYAVQFARLRVAGTPIGANDLWIASHALADGRTLVTKKTRYFERVAGLPPMN